MSRFCYELLATYCYMTAGVGCVSACFKIEHDRKIYKIGVLQGCSILGLGILSGPFFPCSHIRSMQYYL